MMLSRAVIGAVFLMCMLAAATSHADQYHYNNVLIGERASGMGGAYTAISDDATGLYYNPAGIVYSSGKNLSASVNAFYQQTKTYKGAIGGKDWVRDSTGLLPNFFGVIQPIGNLRFGFSYAVPDSITENQDLTVNNVNSTVSRYIINFNNMDNTYNYGPSLATEINKDLSVGLTLYIHQRNVQVINNQIISTPTSTASEWSNTKFQLNEWGYRPVLGVAWSPAEKLSLGLSLSKTYLLSSRARRQDACADTLIDGSTGVCNDTLLNVIPSYDNSKREYPTRAALGVAYYPSSSLILSGDVTYHTAVTDKIYGNKEATVDISLGTEYYLSKNWALRGGLFTDMANTPDIQKGVTNIEEHIDIYGGTASISHFTRNASVTLGGSISAGSGKSQILGQNSIQDATTFGWSLFLSSAYSY